MFTPQLADYDGDGRVDLITGSDCCQEGSFYVFRRLKDGGFAPRQALTRLGECASDLNAKLDTFVESRAQSDRLRAFTDHLLPGEKKRPHGKVRYWNLDRGFGFVTAENGQDVFVHYTAIRETIHKYLREGEPVEFDVAQTDRGPQARNLQILPSKK